MAHVGAGQSNGTGHDQQAEHDQPVTGRSFAGPGEEHIDAPRPHPTSGCCAGQRGWAGAHRHLGVRPRQRSARRERPPHRWC